MKKNTAVLLAALLTTTSLVGCAQNDTKNQKAASTAASASATGASGAASNASAAASLAANAQKVEDHTQKDAYLSGIKAEDYVTLGKYKGIEVSEKEVVVSEEEIQARMEVYKQQQGLKQVKDRDTVQSGDTVNINYTGKREDTGKAFEGGTASNVDLKIGSGTFVPGFEDQLIGHKVGESFNINITFPKDYSNSELAGKKTIFAITINSISNYPELTDAYIKTLGIDKVESKKQLHDYVEKDIRTQQEKSNLSALKNDLQDQLRKSCTFKELPKDMISRYVALLHDNVTQNLQIMQMYYGSSMTEEQYLSQAMQAENFKGSTEDFLKEKAVEEADVGVMFQAIADKEGIKVEDKKVKEEVKKALSSYGMKTAEDYQKAKGLNLEEEIREKLMREAVLDYLVKEAKITKVPAEEAGVDSAEDAAAADSSKSSTDEQK